MLISPFLFFLISSFMLNYVQYSKSAIQFNSIQFFLIHFYALFYSPTLIIFSSVSALFYIFCISCSDLLYLVHLLLQLMLIFPLRLFFSPGWLCSCQPLYVMLTFKFGYEFGHIQQQGSSWLSGRALVAYPTHFVHLHPPVVLFF